MLNTIDERFASMALALADIKKGRPVLIIDEDVEGEGDLCVAAELATPEVINFMVTDCRGLVCQSITADIARRLALPLMVPQGLSPAFTVTVDAATCDSGTSAFDRALTIRALANPATSPADLVRPGHIFPLIARPGGVLERPGHTEASVDLVRLAGLSPSAAICEVMDHKGGMARPKELLAFAAAHGFQAITTRDVIEYRRHFDTAFAPDSYAWNEVTVECFKKGYSYAA